MREKAGLLLPILIIAVAEALYFTGSVESCLALHALNIFACILLPIWDDKRMLMYQSFALVSLLRVLNIGMPVFFTETLLWMPFVYGPIIIAGYIVWRQTVMGVEKMHWRNLVQFLNGHGLRSNVTWKWEYLLIAIIFGYLCSNLEFFLLDNQALVYDLGPLTLSKLLLVMVVFVGFGEELIFRGLLQSSIEKHYGKYLAVFVSALMFAIMHSGYHSIPYLIFVFLVGLTLAYAYQRTSSLGLVALMHGLLNFFLFSFLPFGYGILP
ncbi:MAG TPA: type II CAAX endopeptidase family protein [Methanomassiliicoccales archaeon]|nr:type II CAAX endopeptidase family protein [Methanomassiliicoccales archaeon]